MIDTDVVQKFYKKKESELRDLLDINPIPVRPVVTQQDATNGYLFRYFIRPVNDKTHIVEIDKKQYDILKSNARFITVSIKWKIVGKRETNTLQNGANMYGVGDMNRIEVADADLKFGGLKDYIGDYLEFWFSE
jgi:hypothetical protein